MAENESLDLSRVVNLIMENPRLIEEISALAKGGGATETKKNEKDEEARTEVITKEEPASASTYTEARPQRSRRGELLGAMKPYLSKERAKAIDSMLTIVDILDMMKER